MIVIAIAIPAEQPTLRAGAILYALVLIGSFLISSAVGGNADRLGALVAGPVAALVLAVGALTGRRARALIVLAPLLLYWQANAPVTDFVAAASDPAVHSSYYTPLLNELKRLRVGYGARPARIEVVPTVDHWEARWVAPHVMMARGWERQLDRGRNGLFYGSEPLNAATYRRWLTEKAVSLIALPDSPLDYSGKAEAGLLREAGPARHGALPERDLALAPLAPVRGRGRCTARGAPGGHDGRLHRVLHRCRAPPRQLRGEDVVHPLLGDRIRAPDASPKHPADGHGCRPREPGIVHVVIRFSLSRIFSRGPRCS